MGCRVQIGSNILGKPNKLKTYQKTKKLNVSTNKNVSSFVLRKRIQFFFYIFSFPTDILNEKKYWMAFNSLNAFYINKSSQTSEEEAKIFRISGSLCGGSGVYPLSNCKTNGLENMLDLFQYTQFVFFLYFVRTRTRKKI